MSEYGHDAAMMDCVQLSSAASMTMHKDSEAPKRSQRIMAYVTKLERENKRLRSELREAIEELTV